MNWHKFQIELGKLPILIKQFENSIKKGEEVLETIRCLYITEDNIIHLLTPFDFVDTFNDAIKIKSFYTYQVLDN